MRKYCLALGVIIFLAAANCQEDGTYINISSILDINLTLLNTNCNKTAQFCPEGKETSARLETFKLDIENKGDEKISEIMLSVILPKGMKYVNSSYIEDGGGRLEENVDPIEFDNTKNTSIEWYLGEMQAKAKISMLFRTFLECSVNSPSTAIEIGSSALALVSNELGFVPSNYTSINLADCNCTNEPIICSERFISDDIYADVDVYVSEENQNTEAFFSNYSEPANLVIYNITVSNGKIPLNSVLIFAEKHDMMFKNTIFSDPRRGRLYVERDPIVFHEGKKTYLKWNIGSMLADETRSIILEAYLRNEVDYREITVEVMGQRNSEEEYKLVNVPIYIAQQI